MMRNELKNITQQFKIKRSKNIYRLIFNNAKELKNALDFFISNLSDNYLLIARSKFEIWVVKKPH